MSHFFLTQDAKSMAVNHRIAAQLWAEISKIKGRSDGDLPTLMLAKPHSIQLLDRHHTDGLSVYIRELAGPHRVLAYVVSHAVLRESFSSDIGLDWSTLGKMSEGGRPIIVDGAKIQIESATVDIVSAKQNSEYINMVSLQKEVIDRFGPLFRDPDTLREEDFRHFLRINNNHHWSNLHRQEPNLLEQGFDHLRETIGILTDEKQPIVERYNSAVNRQRGMQEAIATAILLVSFPQKYGVWNSTSEKGLRELKSWPVLPGGLTKGETYGKINMVLHELSEKLSVDLWSLDGLLHFILHPKLDVSSETVTSDLGESPVQELKVAPETSLHDFNTQNYAIPAGVSFWWVNNKQTFLHETGGNFLWSPTLRNDGVINEFYENMKRVRPGDIIFAYAGGEIKAIGICSAYAFLCPKPVEFGESGDIWGNEGWKVPVEFTLLGQSLRPKEHMEILAPKLPLKYSPIRATGDGNQGAYLAAVSEDMAMAVIKLLGPSWEEIDVFARSEISSQTDMNEEVEVQVEQVINNRTDLDETEKVQLVKSRRGQGRYRKNLEGFEKACRVTGVSKLKHLRASHIKPWRASNTTEKLDGNNGLLLSPHIDHLFDQGYISFKDNGSLIMSPEADKVTMELWGVNPDRNYGPFREAQKTYLDFHREFIFRT